MNHSDLHRTGRSYRAPYYKIAESAERTESTERRRKARKRRKAQKGTFLGQSGPKKSVQIAAAQPVVDSGRLFRSELATQIIYY